MSFPATTYVVNKCSCTCDVTSVVLACLTRCVPWNYL